MGMSQEKLGHALGLTFQQVQKYEKGANRIGASNLFKISKALKVPVSFFFDGIENGEHAVEYLPDKDTVGRFHALLARVNTPVTDNFFEGVRIEAAHQKERWGDTHDYNKRDADWSALVTYLHGKAVKACYDGDNDKLLHHIITTSAALMHWHTSLNWKIEAVIPELLNIGLSYDQIKGEYPQFADRIEAFRKHVEAVG